MVYLVTGGTGFTGAYVARELVKAGHEVVCYQRSGITRIFREMVPEEYMPKIKIVQGSVADALDLFDVIKKHKVESIVHLAYVLIPYSEIPAMSIRINVDGTLNIFEAARIFNLKRVVWTSSVAVFGMLGRHYGPEKAVAEKDVLYKPTRLYGASKALLEFLTTLYYEKYGVDIIGLRLARIYGIGKLSGGGGLEFTGVVEDAAMDKPVTIIKANSKWTYGVVDDAVTAILKACAVPSTKTRIFNISDGGLYDGWQLGEVIKKVNPVVKVKVEPGYHEVYDFPLQDITEAREELGWVPEYPLDKGIKRVMNYYRQQKGLPPLK